MSTSSLPKFTDRILSKGKNEPSVSLKRNSQPVSSEVHDNLAVLQNSESLVTPITQPNPAILTAIGELISIENDSETVTVYVLESPIGQEEIVVTVEDDNPFESNPELIGIEQPFIVNGEDVVISSWWTIQDGEMAFENWDQLESFVEAQYGTELTTGIALGAEDLAVEIHVVVPINSEAEAETSGTEDINQALLEGVIHYSNLIMGLSPTVWAQFIQTEIKGVRLDYVTSFTTSIPVCKQVRTCQKVFVRTIGFKNVCKNQLVCPKLK